MPHLRQYFLAIVLGMAFLPHTVLPDIDMDEFLSGKAEDKDIGILANSSRVQAVKNSKLGGLMCFPLHFPVISIRAIRT